MAINRLTASQCRRVKGKPTQLCDGAGLWFHRLDNGHAYFSFRYRSPVTGKDWSYGIGPASDPTKEHTYILEEARKKAAALRLQIGQDIDPLDARKASRAAIKAAAAEGERTFRKVAE